MRTFVVPVEDLTQVEAVGGVFLHELIFAPARLCGSISPELNKRGAFGAPERGIEERIWLGGIAVVRISRPPGIR